MMWRRHHRVSLRGTILTESSSRAKTVVCAPPHTDGAQQKLSAPCLHSTRSLLVSIAPPYAIPLLRETQVAQELRVHPLDWAALTLPQPHRLLNAITVVLVALVVCRVVCGLGHARRPVD